MENIFFENGIKLTENQKLKFKKYCDLLIEYNQKFNITAITEREEIYKKHFVDSVFGIKWISCGKVIDVGAGGGFPSIPLKIMNEDLDFTLLEATEKKCEFLNTVIKELDLKNVKVINGRAEELGQDKLYRESFDYCVSRAVARLNILCEYCMPFIKLNGNFIVYKGDAEEEIKEGTSAIKILGGKIKEVDTFDFYGAKRTLINVLKDNHTDKKYPRKNALIRKKPL